MTARIFIVDDEAPARTRLQTLLSDIEAQCPNQLVGMAANAQQAIEGIAASRPDIVLLDVQMPGMNGMELAAHLKESVHPPAVIFVTAYDAWALQAFEVHALDYLLKPVRAARLAESVGRAMRLLGGQDVSGAALAAPAVRQHLSVQERDRVLLVPTAEILYLKAELKYVTVRTANQEYLIEESLSALEAEFASTFIRVHRNALVARHAIIGVEKASQQVDAEQEGERVQESWQVILRGIDDRLPISRRQWPAVKALVK